MSNGREKWKQRGSVAEGTLRMGRVSSVWDVRDWDSGEVVDFAAKAFPSPDFEGCMVGTTVRESWLPTEAALMGEA